MLNDMYETGFEEPEILGSGSHFYGIEYFYNEEDAINNFVKKKKDYLIYIKYINNKRILQYWDCENKIWRSKI